MRATSVILVVASVTNGFGGIQSVIGSQKCFEINSYTANARAYYPYPAIRWSRRARAYVIVSAVGLVTSSVIASRVSEHNRLVGIIDGGGAAIVFVVGMIFFFPTPLPLYSKISPLLPIFAFSGRQLFELSRKSLPQVKRASYIR
ncbi:MAG: hypothetical protein V3U49_02760 [Nitrososphaerales archaeon]